MPGDEPSIESLIADLEGPSDAAKERAAFALVERPDARAVDALIAALPTREYGIKWGATQALGKIGSAAVPAMLKALQNAGVWVRCDLISALAMTRDPRAVGPLIEALNHEHRFVKQGAAASLGSMGDVRAVKPLTTMLVDDDKFVRGAAIEALLRIGEPALPDLDRMAQGYSRLAQSAAIVARSIRAESKPPRRDDGPAHNS